MRKSEKRNGKTESPAATPPASRSAAVSRARWIFIGVGLVASAVLAFLRYGDPQLHPRLYILRATKWPGYPNGRVPMPRDFTGTWRHWLPSGQIASEAEYRDGNLDGPQTMWYEDGTVAARGSFADGTSTGVWRHWYPSGQLASEAEYRGGRMDGLWTTWREDGTVSSRGLFADGKQIGEHVDNHPDGTRIAAHYVDGRKEGEETRTYPDGARNVAHYVDDLKDGTETRFYPDGARMIESEWAAGVQTGTMRIYRPDGETVEVEVSFRGGKLDGLERQWHENGRLFTETSWKEGKKEGADNAWREDGTLWMVFSYREGLQHGVQTWYYPDGGAERQCEMVYDEAHGRWREWDEDGALTVDDVYEDGVRVVPKEEAAPVEEEGNGE